MREFKLERYFAKYEFSAEYLLSPSDCQALSVPELLEMADPELRGMWANLTLGYTESPGHPRLLAAIAEMYDHINPEEVVVGVPEECIFIAMNLMLRKSDQFVHPAPAYQSLYEIAASSGCKPVPWPVTLNGGRWRLDIDLLKSQVSRRMRLFILNFPHNPTGFIPTRKELDEIVAIARENGIIIFSDEMYRFLEHNPADRLPAICDIYENGVSLGGLSKSFSLPGLRIGWLATKHQPLMQNFLRFKDYTTICNSAPSEILAIIGLHAKEPILERNRNIVAGNLALAKSFFDDRSDLFQWIAPQGGSTAYPKLLADIAVTDFCNDVVEKQSVMVLPASVYDDPGNHFRVGLGRKNFPEALQRFEQYLNHNWK